MLLPTARIYIFVIDQFFLRDSVEGVIPKTAVKMQLYQPGAPRPYSHHRCSLFRVMPWLFYLLEVICIVMQRHVSILFWDVQLDEIREYTEETVDKGFYAHGSYDKTKYICLRLLLKTTDLVVQNPSNNTIFEGHPNQQKCSPSQKSRRCPPLDMAGHPDGRTLRVSKYCQEGTQFLVPPP